MPREARRPVSYVVIAAIIGIAAQGVTAGLWLGRIEATKADRSEIAAARNEWRAELVDHERRFTDHIAGNENLEGRIVTELKNIDRRLESIEDRLP